MLSQTIDGIHAHRFAFYGVNFLVCVVVLIVAIKLSWKSWR